MDPLEMLYNLRVVEFPPSDIEYGTPPEEWAEQQWFARGLDEMGAAERNAIVESILTDPRSNYMARGGDPDGWSSDACDRLEELNKAAKRRDRAEWAASIVRGGKRFVHPLAWDFARSFAYRIIPLERGWQDSINDAREVERLAALHPDWDWVELTDPDDLADIRQQREVAAEVHRITVREEAKAIHLAQQAETLELPTAVSMADVLATEFTGEAFVIDGLMPAGGVTLFSAQRKAGKTVAIHNLVRSLVDGDPFLDHFKVNATRRVALLDFELSDRTLADWLREQGIKNTGNVALTLPLRGRANTFDIRTDRVRDHWVQMLRDSGTEVLILDPLRPIIDAMSLNEWNELGVFFAALAQLTYEAGISETVISHHHGHHAQRAAGDSRLEGTPDALWKLTRDDPEDPRAFRYFEAYGRDVDVQPGLVSLNGKRLTFAADVRTGKDDRLAEKIAEYVTANPGAKAGDIALAGIRGVSKNTVSSLLETAEANGLIRHEPGARNARFYYSVEYSNPSRDISE